RERSVHFQAHVVVESRRVVLVHHERRLLGRLRRRSGRRLGRYREVALRLVLRKSLAQSRPALAVAPAGGGGGGRSLLRSTAGGHSGTLRTEEVDQQPVHSLGRVGLYPVAGLGVDAKRRSGTHSRDGSAISRTR